MSSKASKALTPEDKTNQPEHRSSAYLVRRLFRDFIRPYRWLIVAALVCMSVVAGAGAFTAWLMKPMVNEVFIGEKEGMLWIVGGAVLATFIVKGLANYAQAMLMSFVGLRIIADSQNRLFAHLIRMDISFFHDRPTGKLVSRFTIDINSMRVAVSNALTSFGKDLLSLIGFVTVMFIQDWMLAAMAFFVFPLAIYPIARLGRRMRKVTANTQEEMGIMTTLLEQTFHGIRVVKAYCMEEYEKNRMKGVVERIFTLNFKSARIRAMSSPIMETLGGAAIAVVVVYGGYRVIRHQTDAGSFFSFITALLLAYEPMKRLANLNASLQEGLAGAQRMFDLLDREPKLHQAPDAIELRTAGSGIRFDRVSFAYTPGIPTLVDVSLAVPAGGTVALVGPSGAGKSTILNLIPRFHDVDEGAILVDGTDVRKITFASLHANIALVSQEITLFDDTVRANIAYGRAGAGEEEIEKAARNAAAHDFIIGLADGYSTMIGERGVRLSGGQRQRLAIARAMLKNAPILLLDEATSSLDTESERQVQAALKKLMSGRTTLVIAHRLSTVINADLIYVIKDGRVAEQGSHAELLAKGAVYARLYELQFAEERQGADPAAGRPSQP